MLKISNRNITLNMLNTASLQLVLSNLRYLLGLSSQIKSTPQIFPRWLRWLTHCILTYKQDKEFNVPTIVYVDRKPTEIKCDCEYKLVELPGNIGYDIEFSSGIGEHEIEIEF